MMNSKNCKWQKVESFGSCFAIVDVILHVLQIDEFHNKNIYFKKLECVSVCLCVCVCPQKIIQEYRLAKIGPKGQSKTSMVYFLTMPCQGHKYSTLCLDGQNYWSVPTPITNGKLKNVSYAN